MNIPKTPYIKPQKSCFNPIVVNGIPKFADAANNPKVVGTPDYLKWFEEQIYYIHNGFTSYGMTIPGRYYYYLNFAKFDTIMGTIYPQPCDLHLEMAYFIDECKMTHKNGLFPKKRRGGISEFFNIAVVDYGYRFIPGYKAGVAAGHLDHVLDFMSKWSAHDEKIISEFKLKKLVNKKDEKVAGWKVKEVDGFREYGTMNTIYARTMGENPGLFKGLYLNDVLAEEYGEFEHSKEFYEATKHCLMMGSVQMGNFWGYGTGDRMDKGMKAFQHAWNNPDLYNFERFFIKASRFHFPYYGGAKDEHGKIVEIVPNLLHLTPEERLGVEDIVAAEESLKKVRENLAKTGDTQSLIKECQNNPLEVNEVFRKTTTNHFDATILNNIHMDIESNSPRYTKYKLKWKTNEKGVIITPLEVVMIPAKGEDEEKECVLISDNGHPLPNATNIYCAGIDSYDLDSSKTTKSLGAMCVRIRDNDISTQQKNKPVCVIRCRPKYKEIFYEMCLMVSVLYNLKRSVLIDVRNNSIFEYFKSNEGKKFLAPRPVKFESEKSEQTHEFGVALTRSSTGSGSKNQMISLMQKDIGLNGTKFDFSKLIEELKNYDEIEIDSDNDLADAYGISLMQDVSMMGKPLSDEDEKNKNKRFEINSLNEESGHYGEENVSKDHEKFGY